MWTVRLSLPALALSLLHCASSSSVKSDAAPASQPASAPASAPAYGQLLKPWEGPYGGVPPWDQVEPIAKFEPAMKEAAASLEKEIAAIAANPEPASFDNTLLALEMAGKPLERVTTLFFTLTGSRNTPDVQTASGALRPMVAQVMDSIYFNEALFARVQSVYESREGLEPEQKRLAEKTYDNFVRRGANLSAEDKVTLGKMNQALETLFNDFANRVLADENTWVVLTEDDLEGLPESLISTYARAAKERGLEGFAVVNTRSAVDPFLTFSSRRDLREKVWTAFVSRGDHGNENDTKEIIAKIVKMRAERAQLLGYESHAHWRMSDTMAKEPKNAMKLMMKVWPAAKRKVRAEVRAMTAIARKEQKKRSAKIEPWDYKYYIEKYRKRKFALDQNEFKNYFELNNIVKASYFMAEKLYGLAFKEITGTVPTFHPDVRVFEVRKSDDDSFVGLLYRDDFARQYKRSGAWMSSYRQQEKLHGDTRPIVSNNNNFTKAGEGEPILISLDDATTLFHEFGHAIHGLLNATTYPSLANTPRDFVEYPSQVHENWLLTREVLDTYARHFETDQPMPARLIQKVRRADTYNQGFATVEYLSAAILDMKMHMDPTGEIDPTEFEKSALKEIGMPDEIVLRHRLPQFMHLFSSDAYSAGYYSYLWSDVMATDTWAAFERSRDPWNPKLAKKFEELILANGDAIDRADAYRQFRGRDPDVRALLRNRGL